MLCASISRRIPGYATATPDTLQRRFLSTGGHILNHGNQIVVRLDRRTYSPVLRQANLPADLRPLARRPHRALRVRVNRHKMRVNSLSENRR